MRTTGAEAGNALTPAPDPADAGSVVSTPKPASAVVGSPDGGSPQVPSRNALLVRVIVAVGVALLAGIGAWLLLQRGIHTDAYPPFLPGDDSTPITRYSGPWLTAAAGVGLLAALALLSAAVGLVRWRRSPRSQ